MIALRWCPYLPVPSALLPWLGCMLQVLCHVRLARCLECLCGQKSGAMPAASPSSLHAQREDKQVEMQFSDTVGLPVIKSYDCLQHRRVTWSYVLMWLWSFVLFPKFVLFMMSVLLPWLCLVSSSSFGIWSRNRLHSLRPAWQDCMKPSGQHQVNRGPVRLDNDEPSHAVLTGCHIAACIGSS